MVSSAVCHILICCVRCSVSRFLIENYLNVEHFVFSFYRIVEFVVLLSIILSCTKISNGKNANLRQPSIHSKSPENIYMENIQNSNSNSIPSNIEIRDHYIQPSDFYSSKNNTAFKPVSKYQYHISKSYLV